ncbi:gamma-glutamylcyclotransferase family protein [Metamycoplasma hyosynoviae]|uniref:gamma-glutamylcyclotransferase family protein n=1 Tax=Metamycoplasma hyosynoviae TaxID=29559 RepID=UPI00249A2209|nr:gamma-glutamylcyclotransferase family protein [Metamycoplasma hyosynoviae]MDI3064121.1 gamma-glutamylcyclotransferase [Metamycoplasma hyosynoviae]
MLNNNGSGDGKSLKRETKIIDGNYVNVFIYQAYKEDLYSKLLKYEEKHPARLNGFKKMQDEAGFVLIKKDPLAYVDGYVFKISLQELIKLDRWFIFPVHVRFNANIITLDNNTFIDDAEIYTKLELGAAKPTDDENAKSPTDIEPNVEMFLKFEEVAIKDPLYDFIFLYEISDEEFEEINKIPYPFLMIVIKSEQNKESYITLAASMITIKSMDKKQSFAAVTIFGRNDFMNVIDYSRLFNNTHPSGKCSIEMNLTFLDNKLLPKFLKDKKPDYFLSIKKDDKDFDKLGIKDNSFEQRVADFPADPFDRFNILLTQFFEAKKNKLL